MAFLAKKNLFLFFSLLVVTLAFFLRFYQLGSIPSGLYPDETAIGYNAYSIVQTGKDEYGTPYPLYFRSYDDYKLPVYMYLTAGAIKLLGPTAMAVRLPSALFGIISVISLFLLVTLLSKNKWLGLLSAFLLAINPWHVYFSRTGYEVQVATACMLIGMLFFIYAVKKKYQVGSFLLSALFFLIAVYTYNLTRLLSPILFFFMLLYFGWKGNRTEKKQLIPSIIFFSLGLLPFIVTFFTLQSQEGFSTQKDALIIGNEVKADIILTRSYFASLPVLLQKLLFNYPILVAWTYLKNLISFFSTNFYFITGSNKPNQNIDGGMSMFYYFEFPLIIYGAYIGIKKRLTWLYPIYLWFIIIFLLGSLVKIVPNGTRTFPVIIPFIVFSAVGLYSCIQHIWSIKRVILKLSSILLLSAFILYSAIFYYLSYFYRMPIENARDWQSEDEKMVHYVRSIEQKYDRIIFDESTGFIYTSLLFYGTYPPEKHQKEAVYIPKGLVVGVASDGKYEFRKVDWKTDLTKPKTLIITSDKNKPENITSLNTFIYPTRPVAIYIDRKISQYPTADVAYILYESQTNNNSASL